MNALFFATLLCLGAVVSAHGWAHEDGSYKGEGEAESQDYGQYDHEHGIYGVLPYQSAHYAVAPVHYSGAHYAVAPVHYAGAHYAGAYAGAYAHGAAPLGHDGNVIDTPEVAHAKAAHFAAKAAATHGAHEYSAYTPSIYAAYTPAVYSAPVPAHYAGAHYAGSHYAGAYAYGPAPLGADGNVIDTPEVAHAKIQHFAAKAAAVHEVEAANHRDHLEHAAHSAHVAHVAAPLLAYAPQVYGVHAAPAYYGAYSHGAAPIGHDGQVVDTVEVAHAKAAHFAAKAVAAQESHSVYGALSYGAPAVYGVHAAPAYHGVYSHEAAPIGHDGQVVDTVEVAHAKAAHFAAKAVAAQESHSAYGALSYGAPAAYDVRASPVVYGVHAAPAYHGAYSHEAAPIGHDGQVVDTVEVAHAKAAHYAAKAAAAHEDYHYASHGQW